MSLMHVQRFQRPLAHITIGTRILSKFSVRETLGGEVITQFFKFIRRDASMRNRVNLHAGWWGRGRVRGLQRGRGLQRRCQGGRVQSQAGVRDRDRGWGRRGSRSRSRSRGRGGGRGGGRSGIRCRVRGRFRGRFRAGAGPGPGADGLTPPTAAATTGQRHDERYGCNETCDFADSEKHMRGGQKRGKEGAPSPSRDEGLFYRAKKVNG